MRGAIVAGLVVAGLLCALAGRGSPPAAQSTQPPGPGPLPAPGVRIGPDDVVVEDWQTGPLGQMGVPAGWEGQTWGKTSAFAVSVVLDEGQRVLLDPVGHRLDDRAGEEHPRLRGVDPDVGGDRVELRADEPRRHLVDGGHLTRVLRREGDDRRHAVDARRGERLQVGLDPGPSAGIGARNRDAAWNQRTPFAGMTRIRFSGCDLSLSARHPGARTLASDRASAAACSRRLRHVDDPGPAR